MNIGYARASTLDQTSTCKCGPSKKPAARGSFARRSPAPAGSGGSFSGCSISSATATRSSFGIDRLARSTRDLLETMETIRESGARFRSLSGPWADTTTHAGKLIMTVFAGIAEFERDLIRNAPVPDARLPNGGGFTSGALESSTPTRQNWRAG